MANDLIKVRAVTSAETGVSKKAPNGRSGWYEVQISHIKKVKEGDLNQAGKAMEAVSRAGIVLTSVSRALSEGHNYEVEEFLTTQQFHNLANLTGELLISDQMVAAYQVLPMTNNLLGPGENDPGGKSLIPKTKALESAQQIRSLSLVPEVKSQPIEMVVVSGTSEQATYLSGLPQLIPLESSAK